ncbi:MAG: N-acetyltransferase [Pseudomonadota bacterium]
MPFLDLESPDLQSEVDALYNECFGPGRFAKTAERLREGALKLAACSFVAFQKDSLAGAARAWSLAVDGRAAAAFVGPVAVRHAWRGDALGLSLLNAVCEAATLEGWTHAVLIGDAPYFGRAGFAAADPALIPPGPVASGRLLVRPLNTASPLIGEMSPGVSLISPRAARQAS